MQTTLLARANSLDSLTAIFTHLSCVCQAIHICRFLRARTTKQKSTTYSTNTMTATRTGQQNSEVMEPRKGAKSGNPARKKSGKSSAVGEKTLLVLCLAALYTLQVADDCRNTRSKMMSQHAPHSEVCATPGNRKRTIHPQIWRQKNRGNCTHHIRTASTRVRNATVELSCHNIYATTLRQLIMRFRQLLALCYHQLV